MMHGPINIRCPITYVFTSRDSVIRILSQATSLVSIRYGSLTQEVKPSESETDHSRPSIAEVKYDWMYNRTPSPTRLQESHRDKLSIAHCWSKVVQFIFQCQYCCTFIYYVLQSADPQWPCRLRPNSARARFQGLGLRNPVSGFCA